MTEIERWSRGPEDIRREIAQRIDRETQYVLKLAECPEETEESDFLLSKIDENDRTIKLLGEFLKSKGCEWEKFYFEKFWDEEMMDNGNHVGEEKG